MGGQARLIWLDNSGDPKDQGFRGHQGSGDRRRAPGPAEPAGVRSVAGRGRRGRCGLVADRGQPGAQPWDF